MNYQGPQAPPDPMLVARQRLGALRLPTNRPLGDVIARLVLDSGIVVPAATADTEFLRGHVAGYEQCKADHGIPDGQQPPPTHSARCCMRFRTVYQSPRPGCPGDLPLAGEVNPE